MTPSTPDGSRLDVAILMGGMSSEHEVSLASGRMVWNALDRTRYRAWPVVLEMGGTWLVPREPDGPIPEAPGSDVQRLSVGQALDALREARVAVAFLALHGPFGEDGTIQGMLDLAGMRYTGSGVLASSLAMDKERSRWLFEHHDLPIPKGACVHKGAWTSSPAEQTARLVEQVPGPWVVKPVDQGSSVGIFLIDDPAGFDRAFAAVYEHTDRVLVEEQIVGDELTCGVLERETGPELQALPVTLIRPKEDAFFDYHAKYTPGATEEITPAPIPDETAAEVQALSLKAFELLGCAGMARFDYMLRNGTPYLLEGNTIPGMTETSLLPQAAAEVGLPFPALLDRLIAVARKGTG